MTAHLLLTLTSVGSGGGSLGANEQSSGVGYRDTLGYTGIHWDTLGYTGSSSQTVLDGSPVHQHINGVGWFTREAAIVQGGQQQRPPDGLRRINSFDTI